MHSPSLSSESRGDKSEEEVLLSVTSLVTEGRIPEKLGLKSKGFREGPHCFSNKKTDGHTCDSSDSLCANYEFFREEVLRLWVQNLPIMVDVMLTCGCQEGEYSVGPEMEDNCILLESWCFNIMSKRYSAPPSFQLAQLISAIRSQLYFSQITAWLTTPNENTKKRLTSKHLRYRVAQPGDSSKTTKFMMNPVEHHFPTVEVGYDTVLKVSFSSMPRMSSFPIIQCPSCKSLQETNIENVPEIQTKDKLKKSMFIDRIPYSLNGKHHCDDNDRSENEKHTENLAKFKRLRQNLREEQASTSTINHINTIRHIQNKESRLGVIDTSSNKGREPCGIEENINERLGLDNDIRGIEEDKSESLLEAIERVGLRTPEKAKRPHLPVLESMDVRECHEQEMEITAMNIQCGKCPIDPAHKSEESAAVNFPQLIEHPSKNHNGTCTKTQLFDCVCDNNNCDIYKSDIKSSKNILVDKNYSDGIPITTRLQNNGSNNLDIRKTVAKRLMFGDKSALDRKEQIRSVIPSSVDQTKFKKTLDNAASMVFHKSGLPLMSSPAPARRGKTCFDFDSSIGSVTDIKKAFFSSSYSTDDDSESDGSQMSPCSPETFLAQKAIEEEKEPKTPTRWPRRRKGQACNLLGW